MQWRWWTRERWVAIWIWLRWASENSKIWEKPKEIRKRKTNWENSRKPPNAWIQKETNIKKYLRLNTKAQKQPNVTSNWILLFPIQQFGWSWKLHGNFGFRNKTRKKIREKIRNSAWVETTHHDRSSVFCDYGLFIPNKSQASVHFAFGWRRRHDVESNQSLHVRTRSSLLSVRACRSGRISSRNAWVLCENRPTWLIKIKKFFTVISNWRTCSSQLMVIWCSPIMACLQLTSVSMIPSMVSAAQDVNSFQFISDKANKFSDTMAPEIHLGNSYGQASDWWAVGITYCDFRDGKCIFDDTQGETSYSDNTVKKRPKLPKEMSPRERGFVLKLLSKDPTTRLGAKGVDEVKTHDLFRNVDWNDVLDKKVSCFSMCSKNRKTFQIVPPFVPTLEQIDNLEFFPADAINRPLPTFEWVK